MIKAVGKKAAASFLMGYRGCLRKRKRIRGNETRPEET